MSSEANDPVVVEKNLAMRARDGVTLFADVYRPAVPGRFPVLVIRSRTELPRQGRVRRIIVPVDGSKLAEASVPWSGRLARLLKAALVFVHVSPFRRETPPALQERMTRVCAGLRKEGVKASFHEQVGDPADRILPAALNQASGGIVSRHLLHDAVLLERPGHTPRAMAVVPPHAEDLDRVLRIAGTDEHLDGVAAIDARGGRVAFDLAFECGVRELPVGVGRLLVFDHDWIESRRMRNGRLERRDDEQQQHRHTAIITSRDARSVDDGSPGAGAAGARCQRSPRRRHRRDR